MTSALEHTGERIRNVLVSEIIEVVDLARHEKDVIKLWVGESDLTTPDFIREAAIAALQEGQTHYTYSRGIPSLREALAQYLSHLYATSIDVDRISVTVGGMQAVMLAFQALVDAGEEVVIPSPAWTNVFEAAKIVGARIKDVPIRLGNAGWNLDIEEMFAAVTPRTRVLVVNSPHNPTGWIMSREEMVAVLEFARRHGLWILTDEVYTRITFDIPRATSFLELCEPEDRIIATNTFSKCWAMTGWRTGWVVAPPSLADVFENLLQYGTTGVATFVQHGAEAAIRGGEDFLASFVERCRCARDLVCDALDDVAHLRFERPGGTFYLFFQVEDLTDSKALAIQALREAKVGILSRLRVWRRWRGIHSNLLRTRSNLARASDGAAGSVPAKAILTLLSQGGSAGQVIFVNAA